MFGIRPLLVAVISGLILVSVSARSYAQSASEIRVLVVDGFGNHDWQATTDLILEILSEDTRLKVEVSTVPAGGSEEWKNWLPRFGDYSVVIQNTNSLGKKGSWPEAARLAFEKYMEKGGGMFVFHSANNSFEEWPEYNRMIGLGWRKKDFGKAIEIRNGEPAEIPAGEGANTSHGRRNHTLVKRLGNHPIHAGLPGEWMAAELEVYRYARGPAENLEVISYAADETTGISFPIEWTVKYGEGRVYNSTYGHYWHGMTETPDGARCIAFRSITKRAVRWLAGVEVDAEVPEDFPKATGVSLK